MSVGAAHVSVGGSCVRGSCVRRRLVCPQVAPKINQVVYTNLSQFYSDAPAGYHRGVVNAIGKNSDFQVVVLTNCIDDPTMTVCLPRLRRTRLRRTHTCAHACVHIDLHTNAHTMGTYACRQNMRVLTACTVLHARKTTGYLRQSTIRGSRCSSMYAHMLICLHTCPRACMLACSFGVRKKKWHRVSKIACPGCVTYVFVGGD